MDPKRLREETRAEHESTEAVMPVMGPELTRELYGRVLVSLLGVVEGWEAWADGCSPKSVAPLLAKRQRSGLLQSDLEYLGVERGAAVELELDWGEVVVGEAGDGSGPEFEAAFLGAMYVMEGSTLGGRFIARHVEEALGLEPGQGDAYFRGHEEATGSMWREVTGEIEKVPEGLAPVVIAAAKRTFRAFGDALRAGLDAQERVYG